MSSSHASGVVRLPERFEALPAWLRKTLQLQQLDILRFEKMSGGAIQENWAFDARLKVDGESDTRTVSWVLRSDAQSTLETSLGRAQEYALLEVMATVDVKAPKPVLLCDSPDVTGRPFYIMQRLPGEAQARKLVRAKSLASFGPSLAQELGRQLARIHTIRPGYSKTVDQKLSFLDSLSHPLAGHSRVSRYRDDLQALQQPAPVLEYGLNWLQQHCPQDQDLCLCHCDYRTGNYLVDDGELSAILDWEFAAWSDPYEDIGWLTARCWRFGNDELEAGGIAGLECFIEGYEQTSGKTLSVSRIRYWQIMAEVRWAVIAMQQAERHFSGQQLSLELALTERLVPEMEFNMLMAIADFETPVACKPERQDPETNPKINNEIGSMAARSSTPGADVSQLSAECIRQSSLLDAALSELEQNLLSDVSSKQRYSVAMLKRTLQILQRELRVGASQAAQQLLQQLYTEPASCGIDKGLDDLATDIRQHRLSFASADAVENELLLQRALMSYTQQRLAINNPSMLDRVNRNAATMTIPGNPTAT